MDAVEWLEWVSATTLYYCKHLPLFHFLHFYYLPLTYFTAVSVDILPLVIIFFSSTFYLFSILKLPFSLFISFLSMFLFYYPCRFPSLLTMFFFFVFLLPLCLFSSIHFISHPFLLFDSLSFVPFYLVTYALSPLFLLLRDLPSDYFWYYFFIAFLVFDVFPLFTLFLLQF